MSLKLPLIFLYVIVKTSRNISASTKDKDSKYPGNPGKGANSMYILSDVEEVEPDTEELESLRRYEAGDPDYQPSISTEDLKKELGL